MNKKLIIGVSLTGLILIVVVIAMVVSARKNSSASILESQRRMELRNLLLTDKLVKCSDKHYQGVVDCALEKFMTQYDYNVIKNALTSKVLTSNMFLVIGSCMTPEAMTDVFMDKYSVPRNIAMCCVNAAFSHSKQLPLPTIEILNDDVQAKKLIESCTPSK
jgi:hypothetical protein